MRRILVTFGLTATFAAADVSACEPVIPFIMTVGGPILMTQSALVLLLAIAMKCVLFARFQTSLTFGRAAGYMFVGNILTTFIGAIAATMIGASGFIVPGMVIVFALCWLPARRIPALAPRTRLPPGAVALLMTLAMIVSCFLFAVSPAALERRHLGAYWVIKLIAVYTALIVSIALTSLWEEWVVWKFSHRPPEDRSFIAPVIRANLYVLLAVTLYGAAIMLPKRLASPDFLATILGR
jgi:hypothetical protein